MKYTKPNWTEIFDDDRPLTDETLEELGFVYSCTHNYTQNKEANWWLVIVNGELYAMKDKEDDEYEVRFVNVPNSPAYKTVGSVKMLIEALKGDE